MLNCNGNTGGCGELTGQPAAENQNLSITAVARMFKISSLALRVFEWRGFIRRTRVGDAWVYRWSDCERIALLVKARKAGVPVHELATVLRAMDDQSSNPIVDDGRLQCLSLIHTLEGRKKAIGDVLAELYRVDWELSDRLGVEGSLDNGASVENL
jgi:DNA-binding transcriptional MerR regulator